MCVTGSCVLLPESLKKLAQTFVAEQGLKHWPLALVILLIKKVQPAPTLTGSSGAVFNTVFSTQESEQQAGTNERLGSRSSTGTPDTAKTEEAVAAKWKVYENTKKLAHPFGEYFEVPGVDRLWFWAEKPNNTYKSGAFYCQLCEMRKSLNSWGSIQNALPHLLGTNEGKGHIASLIAWHKGIRDGLELAKALLGESFVYTQ